MRTKLRIMQPQWFSDLKLSFSAVFGSFSLMVMDGHMDRHTDGRKDGHTNRDARMHLKEKARLTPPKT